MEAAVFGQRLTLFQLFGFHVRVDLSWVLLAILITWSLAVGYFPAVMPGLAPITYWWMGVAGLIGLAFSIVVHELAHSLVARRFDMPIRGITLFVFGGVAEMTEEPASAKGELLMAIAGPLTSFALAGLLFLLASAGGALAGADNPAVAVIGYLALLNAVLAIFNMVPAFPLDGGRVLRAALWGWKKDIVWATRIAAGAGTLFGMLLVAFSLYNLLAGNVVGAIWWFLIGFFVQGAAASALQGQLARSALSGQPVRRFMRRDAVAVSPALTIERLVDEYFYRYFFKTLPVVENDRLVGVVAIDDVKTVGRAAWSTVSVAEVMEPVEADSTVSPDADSASALAQMQRAGKSRLLVASGGRLVGILSLRDLLNYLSVRFDLAEKGGAATDLRRAS